MNQNTPMCVFFNTYYSKFIDFFYEKYPNLRSDTYENQKNALMNVFFGDCDFYSKGLEKAGFRAEVFVGNIAPLQQAWALENGYNDNNSFNIALEQVKRLRPQVVYIQDMADGTRGVIEAFRPFTDLIVGQIASPIPEGCYLEGFDIIFSSFPHFVVFFRENDLISYYQPLAFEPRVLENLPDMPKKYPATFIGSISPLHEKGEAIISRLIELIEIDLWGFVHKSFPADSPILKKHHGAIWGLDMFSLFKQSLITVNRHIDVAAHYANNMRLFEATGCGAMLLTDYKDNLNELFEIGKEVVAYRTTEECAELIKYYLHHPDEAMQIAMAGQRRTLRDHTYEIRMKQTARILKHHLIHKKKLLD